MLLLRALRQSQQVVTQHQRPLQSSVLGWYGGNRTALAQQSVQVRTKKKKAGGSGSTSASAASTRKVLDLRADVKSLIDLKKYDDSMLNTIESLKKTYSRMRSGTTVSPDFLDDLAVDAYGSRTSLKTLAQVSVRDGRTLFITTFDESREIVNAIEKAVRSSGLNLNPICEGSGRLRIPVPKPSQESRLALKEAAQREAEAAKVATRMIRRKALEEVKQLKDDIPKDDAKRLERNIQSMTDDSIARINDVQKTKENAIMDTNLSVRK